MNEPIDERLLLNQRFSDMLLLCLLFSHTLLTKQTPLFFLPPLLLHPPPPRLCPLTCPLLSSLTAQLPRLSPISSHLVSVPSLTSCLNSCCNSGRAQCDQRTVLKQMYHWQTSDNTAQFRPSSLSFVITDSSVKKKRNRRQGFGFGVCSAERFGHRDTHLHIYTTHSQR